MKKVLTHEEVRAYRQLARAAERLRHAQQHAEDARRAEQGQGRPVGSSRREASDA